MQKHEAEKLAVEYLKVHGCAFSGERIGSVGMLKFAIPGQSTENGRLMVRSSNELEVWNTASTRPLSLPSPWRDAEPKTIGTRQIPAKTVAAADLQLILHARRYQPKPVIELSPPDQPPKQVQVFADAAVAAAAQRNLENQGWTFGRQLRNGIIECNDGGGRRDSCRMVVKNGIASVWSYRGDLNLSSPWQSGRLTKDGCQTLYATGRTLNLGSDQVIAVRDPLRVAPRLVERGELYPGTVEFVRRIWTDNLSSPRDHPALNKYGARLDPGGLRAIGESGTARKQWAVGNLLVPLYRPDGDNQDLELAGGQRWLQTEFAGSDKYFLVGTPARGVMALIPPPHDLDGGLHDWLKQTRPDKPLILAESVAAGMALHQAGCGNVICAMSAKNLPVVAQWIQDAGIKSSFPAGITIAADNDHELTPAGKLKSTGILDALHAADILTAKVALTDHGKHGMDARDLLAEGGERAVHAYMTNLRTSDEIRCHRTDIFPVPRVAISNQLPNPRAVTQQISPACHIER